ncbi:DUF2459 domain-containing protein [Brevundimonas balnearis]|uniref:DUF2459 domain-containing protein n=1 Tax=Brevundimonas balnearis TaxID=1572858 RepID=A0ABV6R2P3_9CAUL
MAGGLIRLTLAAVLGLAAGVWTWVRPGGAFDGPPAVEVHVLDNGFHTDLAVRRDALEARTGPLADAVRTLPPGRWVRLGWGDARFFVDQSPIHERLPDGARAFFAPGNPSVVMLDPEDVDPRRYADRRVTLALSDAAFDALAARVEGALALSDGRARLTQARPGAGARFYAGRETFSVLRLCNHWTAEVLSAGGVTIRPAASILSGQVLAAARVDSRAVRD